VSQRRRLLEELARRRRRMLGREAGSDDQGDDADSDQEAAGRAGRARGRREMGARSPARTRDRRASGVEREDEERREPSESGGDAEAADTDSAPVAAEGELKAPSSPASPLAHQGIPARTPLSSGRSQRKRRLRRASEGDESSEDEHAHEEPVAVDNAPLPATAIPLQDPEQAAQMEYERDLAELDSTTASQLPAGPRARWIRAVGDSDDEDGAQAAPGPARSGEICLMSTYLSFLQGWDACRQGLVFLMLSGRKVAALGSDDEE
jgi:hypothetical protein